jgi:hypothetical protein
MATIEESAMAARETPLPPKSGRARTLTDLVAILQDNFAEEKLR